MKSAVDKRVNVVVASYVSCVRYWLRKIEDESIEHGYRVWLTKDEVQEGYIAKTQAKKSVIDCTSCFQDAEKHKKPRK